METRIVPLPTRVRQELTFRKDELESILPEWMTYKRFVNMSLMAIARTPALAKCDFPSIYLSLMECARLGLYPDGRQAAIVPFKGRATLLPMVQGIIELMLRAPKVAKVESRVVYSGDHFVYSYGLVSHLEHVPLPDGTNDREIIGSYAIVFWEHTKPTFEVVTRDELDKARQSSSAPNSPAWVIWEGEQCRKVATKRVSKYVDLTPEAQLLIEWDHAIYGDPSMEGSVEGPSQEYTSQHVKAETEAKLESLKERIEGNGKEEEPDPEPETKTEEPEVIEEQPVRAENHWEDEILDFVVTEQFVAGEDEKAMRHHAIGILNYSPFVEIPYGDLELVPAVAWFLAWNRISEKHPKTKAENKAPKVLKLWESEQAELLELAVSKIPPDKDE